MIKLLWIDDNLDHDLTEKRMALYMEDDIDPHFARDATEAYLRLREEHFDVVIVDLRLPPGPDDMWNEHRENGIQKFGYVLLSYVLSQIRNDFRHLSDTHFGVFTIEAQEENPELFLAPISLPEQNFKMKTHAYYENAFVDFIRNVHKSWQ
ncbi:MAG: hypothetical protein IPK76_20020 [Lewinellaceae bacterium]|jgi:CheY-like chemotaxis protein|nr:hypothetical protein [Lewinellaceae bacterium]